MMSTEAHRPISHGWTQPLLAADGNSVGSKAHHLAALCRAGFQVPDGFVIGCPAFDLFVEQGGLDADASQASALEREVPRVVAQEIVAAYRALGAGRVAVRSSGLAEDLADAAFAGQYETVLGVEGEPELLAAVRSCWASVFSDRVRAYRRSRHAAGGSMAVLVQRMVEPIAAGVAFSADPVTGARDVVTVSAVAGLGEGLVSGESEADEWLVRGADAEPRRVHRGVLDREQALAIAALAREVEGHFGAPQDLEWALDPSGKLQLLQARPMTALPEEVVWHAPLPGAWIRNFRLGEWLGDPMSPLFESWLLERMEAGIMARITALFPMTNLPPTHVTVHGWYFYGLYFPEALGDKLKMMWGTLRHMWRDFRYVAGFFPPVAHLGFDRHLVEWRERILPAYRDAVARAESELERAEVSALGSMIDQLADHAAATMFSVIALGGTSAKLEAKLIQLWRKHVDADDAALVIALVRNGAPHETPDHAVSSVDWQFPTAGERARRGEVVHAPVPEAARARIDAQRAEVRAKVDAALAHKPKIARRFAELLAFAQRAHEAREEQASALTLAWPVLRRAVERMAGELVRRHVITAGDNPYFLTRQEIEAALAGDDRPLGRELERRQALWQRQRRLSPPLLLGELTGIWKSTFAMIDDIIGAKPPEGALKGLPGSPGKVTARARVIMCLEELPRLRDGEVLVTRVTTPAWTTAFARAAAVITESGSVASHASVVAREYGIPSVVAVEGACAKLVDGQTVTVDGAGGFVVP